MPAVPSLYLALEHVEAGASSLYEALRRRIVAGELEPGERLPPTRALARDLALSRNAVVAAYRQLVAEGYVEARVGSGTWVRRELPDAHPTAVPERRAAGPRTQVAPRLSVLARHAMAIDPARLDRRLAQAQRECIEFSLESTLADELTTDTWNRLVRERMRHMPDGYGPPEGSRELREALADHLRRNRGLAADPDHIVVVAGAQQGFDLIGRALLPRGSAVLMEDPGFRGARLAFEALGAQVLPCPVDREGIAIRCARGARPAGRKSAARSAFRGGGRWPVSRPASTPTADGRGSPRVAFVTPSHQFPTGAVMSLARRRELLAWAHAANAIVVEDDYEGELRFEGRPLPAIHALDGEGRVVYVGTFSRTLCPDLRLGYLVLPPPLVAPIAALKRLSDWFTPRITQGALAAFLGGGHYQRHIRRLQHRMAGRRRALLSGVAARFGDVVEVTGAASGLHVALWFRRPGPEAEPVLLENARALGVGVHPLSPFCVAPPRRLGVLLGYGGLEEAEIREGLRRLAMAWRATLGTIARHDGKEERHAERLASTRHRVVRGRDPAPDLGLRRLAGSRGARR